MAHDVFRAAEERLRSAPPRTLIRRMEHRGFRLVARQGFGRLATLAPPSVGTCDVPPAVPGVGLAPGAGLVPARAGLAGLTAAHAGSRPARAGTPGSRRGPASRR